MLIRRERTDDIPDIAAVHRAAFALPAPGTPNTFAPGGSAVDVAVAPAGTEPAEVGLVHRLRGDSGWIPTLSLIAERHDTVIGHVCLTRAAVGPFPVLALGPVGVLPRYQGAGVGSALVHAALGAADALDEPLVGLLGSVEYYPRFGFLAGTRVGIVPDEPAWVSHFQVRTLTAYGPGIVGEFRYADPFYSA